MISIFTPQDIEFNYDEVKELYEENQDALDDDNFDLVINRTQFFAYYFNDYLIGCIYFYYQDERLFVNAFAKRGHHLLNLECLKESLQWFDCDIYARTINRASTLCVLRCGFKKVENNIYKYERNV